MIVRLSQGHWTATPTSLYYTNHLIRRYVVKKFLIIRVNVVCRVNWSFFSSFWLLTKTLPRRIIIYPRRGLSLTRIVSFPRNTYKKLCVMSLFSENFLINENIQMNIVIEEVTIKFCTPRTLRRILLNELCDDLIRSCLYKSCNFFFSRKLTMTKKTDK